MVRRFPLVDSVATLFPTDEFKAALLANSARGDGQACPRDIRFKDYREALVPLEDLIQADREQVRYTVVILLDGQTRSISLFLGQETQRVGGRCIHPKDIAILLREVRAVFDKRFKRSLNCHGLSTKLSPKGIPEPVCVNWRGLHTDLVHDLAYAINEVAVHMIGGTRHEKAKKGND